MERSLRQWQEQQCRSYCQRFGHQRPHVRQSRARAEREPSLEAVGRSAAAAVGTGCTTFATAAPEEQAAIRIISARTVAAISVQRASTTVHRRCVDPMDMLIPLAFVISAIAGGSANWSP